MSHLTWFSTICKCVSEVTWRPKFHDFTLMSSFQVSYTFCKDFIAGLVKDMSATDFGRTSVLIKAFQRVSYIAVI